MPCPTTIFLRRAVGEGETRSSPPVLGRVGVRDLQGPLVGAAYAIVLKAASRRLFVETILANVCEENEEVREEK